MTYCVALLMNEGLVFASDSRTNAGVDYVTTYSKTHVFNPAPDRMFVLLSAGNLATTQAVVNRIRRDIEYPEGGTNLLSARYMFEAAEYVGRVSVEVQQQHAQELVQAGVNGETTLILGGQLQGQEHSLFLIYPQGNVIEASPTTPYLQIGETKYGKPVLDRVLHSSMPLEDAARLALVSLNSTSHSNTSVGPPFELSIYKHNRFLIDYHCTFHDRGDYMSGLETAWRDGLNAIFDSLPRFEWESKIKQDSLNLSKSDIDVTEQAQTQGGGQPLPQQQMQGQDVQQFCSNTASDVQQDSDKPFQ